MFIHITRSVQIFFHSCYLFHLSDTDQQKLLRFEAKKAQRCFKTLDTLWLFIRIQLCDLKMSVRLCLLVFQKIGLLVKEVFILILIAVLYLPCVGLEQDLISAVVRNSHSKHNLIFK